MERMNDKENKGTPVVLPTSGDLMLASPWLREPVFSRSVIMMMDVEAENGGNGSMGLVLNHPSPLVFQEFINGIEDVELIPLFIGGPVELERLFLLHRDPEYFEDSVEVAPGIYLGGTVEEIKEYVKERGFIDDTMRLFIGYSGWDNGQLEEELSQEAWAIYRDPDMGEIFTGYGNKYWRRYVAKLNERYHPWLLVPDELSEN